MSSKTVYAKHRPVDTVFVCDTCGGTLKTGEADFYEAVDVLWRENWRCDKHGESWFHTCSNCREDQPKPKRSIFASLFGRQA